MDELIETTDLNDDGTKGLEELPRVRRGGGPTGIWNDRLAPIVSGEAADLGRWAAVMEYPDRPEGAMSMLGNLRAKKVIYDTPEGFQWQFASRQNEEGGSTLYARLLPADFPTDRPSA